MGKKSISYAKWGYIFSIPFVVAFALFTLYPVLYTIIIAFTDLKGAATTEFHILKDDILKNFKEVLATSQFKQSFGNTWKIWIMNFIPQMGLALLLTAWFTDNRSKIKGQGLFKVAFYMPNIITAATVAIMFNAFFGYPIGPINDLLLRFHIVDSAQNFLIKKSNGQNIVAFIQFWMWFGYTMITLISGVIGIDPSIFEAAEMDGANRVQTFIYVTIPSIRTILLFSLVTSLIGGLNMFDIPFLFLNGGPDNATLTTNVFIYKQAFSGAYLYNRAAAASLIMLVIIVIFSSLLFFALRDRDAEKAKKLRKQAIREAKLKAKGVA